MCYASHRLVSAIRHASATAGAALTIFGLWVIHICVKFSGGRGDAGVGGVDVDVAGNGV